MIEHTLENLANARELTRAFQRVVLRQLKRRYRDLERQAGIEMLF